MNKHPCGRCECGDCAVAGPAGCDGPAAFTVVRDGKKMKVCTRCDLSIDQQKTLLVTRDTPAHAFAAWDAFGFIMLSFALQGEGEDEDDNVPDMSVN